MDGNLDGAQIDPAMQQPADASQMFCGSDDGPPQPLYGIRGWLLLFCIIVAFFNPLKLLVDASEAGWAVAAFDVALAAFSVYVGICVARLSPRALPLLKAYFIVLLLLGLGSVAWAAVLAWFTNGAAGEEALMRLAGAGARTAFFVAIWWSYFRRSLRVRNTYGRNL